MFYPTSSDKNSSHQKPIIIAVIDYDFQLNHPALKDALYVNPNEIPNNNIDDDNNGCIDDIHGCDFSRPMYVKNGKKELLSFDHPIYEDAIGCRDDLYSKFFPNIKFQGITSYQYPFHTLPKKEDIPPVTIFNITKEIQMMMKIAADYNKHGTSVASIIAKTQYINQIKILIVQEQLILDGTSVLTLHYADKMNADLISISNTRVSNNFGCKPKFSEETMKQENYFIDCAKKFNRPLFVAAGNKGVNIDICVVSPESLAIPNMMVIGAAEHEHSIIDYSNYGKNVTLAAVLPSSMALNCPNMGSIMKTFAVMVLLQVLHSQHQSWHEPMLNLNYFILI